MNLPLNDRELLFLSDLLNAKSEAIKDEFESYQEEITGQGADPETDDLLIEMQADLAICSNLIQKIQ